MNIYDELYDKNGVNYGQFNAGSEYATEREKKYTLTLQDFYLSTKLMWPPLYLKQDAHWASITIVIEITQELITHKQLLTMRK